MTKRKAKKSSRKAAVKKSVKTPAKKQRMNPAIFLIAVVAVVVLIAAFMSMNNGYVPPASNSNPQQQTQGQGITQTANSQPCKSDLECFVAICKNNPTVWSCVNAVNQTTFYTSCNPADYRNVIQPFKDSTKCACVNGNCQAQ
jgi:hypothetical protein